MIGIPKLANEDSCMNIKCLAIQVHCGGTNATIVTVQCHVVVTY